MRHLVIASLVGLVGSALGCTSSSGMTTQDAMPAPDAMAMRTVTREVKDLPVTLYRSVDLLFLIDDSPSMSDKQANLAANFPRFLDALGTLPGGMPDMHIGVVTSDLGSKGAAEDRPGPGIGTLGQGGCSGLGKAGELQLFGAPVSGAAFLSDVALPDRSRQQNYTGALSAVFATMATAGAGGCGFEQPLEAIKQALSPDNAVNQGFLRSDALLVIVILTDEDDCSFAHAGLITTAETGPLGPLQSFRCTRFGVVCDDGGATPAAMNNLGVKRQCHPAEGSEFLTGVADYAGFLRSLKADPGSIVVASIAGSVDPFAVELRAPGRVDPRIPALAHSCVYIDGDGRPESADPPIRIAALLDQFPNHSATASICQPDLSGGLQQIVVPVRNAMLGSPCVDGALADVDPVTPGPQSACEVSVVTDRGSPVETATALPRCTPEDATATNPPCWRLAVDPASCPSGDHAVVEITGRDLLPASAHVIAKCSVYARD